MGRLDRGSRDLLSFFFLFLGRAPPFCVFRTKGNERKGGAAAAAAHSSSLTCPLHPPQKTKTVYGDDGGSTVHQGSCEFYNLDAHKVRKKGRFSGLRALCVLCKRRTKKKALCSPPAFRRRPPPPIQKTSQRHNTKRHPNQGTGLDIVALSDASPDYPNSCGTCYAVSCRRAAVVDGFGESLDRTSTCHDESRQVVVMVTDTCPCVYPANAMSNKRWCCGDQNHMDLSTSAFRKLGQTMHGVMAARWKRVACPTEPTYLDWDGDQPVNRKQEDKKQEEGKGGSRRMLSSAAARTAPWALGA